MKREIIITKTMIQELYDCITSSEDRFRKLGKVLTEFSDGEFVCNVYDAGMERSIRKTIKVMLGDERGDDFLYLLDECPLMEGGGSITPKNGKVYRIKTVDDLWAYWRGEGLL